MDFNLAGDVIISYIITAGLVALLLNYAEVYLPKWIIHFFCYGKIAETRRHALIEKIEKIPKKLFVHLYLVAGPMTLVLFYVALKKYLYNKDVSDNILFFLDVSLGTSRKPLVSEESTLLAIVMLSTHVWKRAFEQMYVCVFSDQKINVIFYVLGHMYYWTVTASLVGESKGFVRGSHADFSLHKITITQLLCVLIFLWSTYTQLKSNYILAGLRKNQHGDVVTKEHKIPTGGLFNYVSNPLQLTEILVYLALSAVLWQASTFHYVTVFVIINQVEYAYLSHQWYRNTFKSYPKERKIIIPYIW
ncbi:polyprenol reductase-like isoform X1 [Pseudomyrmex gracilis]|uniref:polyprenol reductase-like isoform X1 n=1 Tax=Pseudomyrmex gracilis TaxID=219809 RepID=UPI000994C028|nr:polyprenol reductase-like isoform X1 [Pseudomyrmex gracilis]XP_020278247.1 polyprenol reductase-like isoform X1 [Pseudomyrmex gracilis]XP_020278248.1 polyprenol reductase-like isoform X1 [Pseudomyrmex gracilis]